MTTTAIAAEVAANADTVLAAFTAKAGEVATANGWTADHAKDVMLRYLQNTDPDTAAVIAASFLTGTR